MRPLVTLSLLLTTLLHSLYAGADNKDDQQPTSTIIQNAQTKAATTKESEVKFHTKEFFPSFNPSDSVDYKELNPQDKTTNNQESVKNKKPSRVETETYGDINPALINSYKRQAEKGSNVHQQILDNMDIKYRKPSTVFDIPQKNNKPNTCNKPTNLKYKFD
jgi:hypothetical protein